MRVGKFATNEFKWQTERMSKTINLVCKPCFFHYKARYKYLYVFKWVNKIKQSKTYLFFINETLAAPNLEMLFPAKTLSQVMSTYVAVRPLSSQFQGRIYEPSRGKTNNVVSEQVRHKPGCTVTEDG